MVNCLENPLSIGMDKLIKQKVFFLIPNLLSGFMDNQCNNLDKFLVYVAMETLEIAKQKFDLAKAN